MNNIRQHHLSGQSWYFLNNECHGGIHECIIIIKQKQIENQIIVV